MRIHSVAFSGIGPFTGQHNIDFESLDPGALFLIEGPTGAGKSTILDAIAFGIYGDVAAKDSDAARLRSKHVPDSQVSWVQVVFSTKNVTLRVTRSPKYMQLKTRGEGTREVKPSLKVEREVEPGKWEVETESVREGGMYLQNVIGLDRDQFAQTVLLPQGQFDRFLKANTSERRPILEKIFRTQRFRHMLDLLTLREEAARVEIEKSNSELTSSLTYLAGEIQLPDDVLSRLLQLAETPENDSNLLSEIQTLLEASATAQGTLELERDRLTESLSGLQAELDLRNKERDAQERAKETTRKFNEFQVSSKESKKEIKAEFSKILVDLEINSLSLEEVIAKKLPSLNRIAENLLATISQENEIPGKEAELGQIKQRLKQLDREQIKLKSKIDQLPSVIKAKKTKIRQTTTQASKRDGLEVKLENLISQLDEFKAIQEAKKKLQSASAELKSAAAVKEKAKQKLSDMQRKRLENYASELASSLKKGQPCQVCGSKDHPSKASASATPIGDKDIKQAEAELDEAEANFLSISEHLNTIKAATQATKKSSVSVSEIRSLISKTKTQITAAEAAHKSLEKLEQDLEELEDSLGQSKSELSNVLSESKVLNADHVRISNELVRIRGAANSKKGKYNSVSERHSAIEGLIASLGVLAEQLREEEGTKKSMELAKEELANLPKSKNFGETSLVKSKIENLAPLRDAAVANADRQKARTDALREQLGRLDQGLKTRESNLRSSKTVIELARLAKGKNPFNQDLPSFVLDSMFEDVLVCANARLEKVLDSRFRFEVSQEQGDLRSKQGLGLAIHDNKTGKKGSPGALSGGEGFAAALALALGLSDSVRANQGGISIDTFFVDEGFGSLDPNRLDQVIKMLEQLSSEGRRIGLVSHVESMKERFEEKVVVSPIGDSGTSTLTTTWSQKV